MKLAVFGYNFPHKKTQDFLMRLFLEGYKVEFVIACNPIELNLPIPTIRVKPIHIDVIHPVLICKRLGIPYYVLPHNSPDVAELLKSNQIDNVIIAGARILKKPIIESVKNGIINFHPGIIPQVRGLDALKWAIYNNLPIGATAHFVDERVDAGRIITQEEIPLKKDDTLIDLSLRLEETEINMLSKVLERIKNKSISDFPLVKSTNKYNTAMPKEFEAEIYKRLDDRLGR